MRSLDEPVETSRRDADPKNPFENDDSMGGKLLNFLGNCSPHFCPLIELKECFLQLELVHRLASIEVIDFGSLFETLIWVK